MAATYPGAVRLFTGKVDLVDVVLAEHVNLLQDEVTAVETALGVGLLTSTWSGVFDGSTTGHASVSARLRNLEAGVLSRLDGSTGVTLSGAQTMTNKTMSGSLNTFSAIPQSAVTSLVTDLGLKAPLASPALTGDPTAPTQTAGNSSTRVATTAFVGGAVSTAMSGHESDTTAVHGITDTSELTTRTGAQTLTNKTIDSASNTLTIAQSAVTNLVTNLAAKAPIASPTFTGTVTVVSPTATGSIGARQITMSTSAPSGGADGDVWLVYV